MTTTAMLDDRYGRTRSPARRRAWWIAVAVVGAIIVGALGWMTVRGSLYSVTVDNLGYHVTDSHAVSVDFQFSTNPGTDVTCALQALDPEQGIVGFRVIRYEAGESHQQRHTEIIRTVAEATTGLVEGCWSS
ncbi:DUF4307 domain-containing protein [Microbacterium sp. ZW T5_56]|uniref:DUF4307 domain-containing protein n=1 Tax=Microbacterium sp. ZW T5_56 TaxID=3378081 RepID=UPI003853C75F